MVRLPRSIAALCGALPLARAILCPGGSQCASSCGNVLASTSPDDLVCDQSSFQSNPTGQLYQGCVSCQRSSTYYSGNDSDVQSMLYNLRYAVSYCVWGKVPVKNPNVVDTPCITSKACGSFKDAVQFKNLSTEYDAYQYCDIWPTGDAPDFQGCTDCLQAEGRQYLANFITALQAGCEQKPSPGLFIGLDGEIFSTTAVKISTPSPTSSVNPDWFDHGPLTLGAKVGIAIGGLVGLLILLGCGIVCNGKRRRKAYLRQLDTKVAQRGWPSPTAQREMNETPGQQSFRGWDDTPLSQRPLKGWDDSPLTANSEKTFPRYFSPYSSQYNSPVNDLEVQSMPWPPAVLSPGHGPSPREIGLAVGGADGGSSWNGEYEGKGKAREESYEMHEVDSSASSGSKGARQMPKIEHPVPVHPENQAYERDGPVYHGNMI